MSITTIRKNVAMCNFFEIPIISILCECLVYSMCVRVCVLIVVLHQELTVLANLDIVEVLQASPLPLVVQDSISPTHSRGKL